MELKWRELFPTTCSLITFLLYIFLFIFHAVFITASKNEGNGKYSYNTTLVVLISEAVKLIASSILYSIYRGNKPSLLQAIVKEKKLALLYFIPSLLYCFYNNLSFVNLAHYDPTTYYILLQFRVVITALLFQCLFNKKLNKLQWISLLILTAGCIIQNLNASDWSDPIDTSSWSKYLNIYTLSVFAQSFCSCLAGTYNEYLLKNQGAFVDIFLQNVFMYLDSVLCNFIMIFLRGDYSEIISGKDLKLLLNLFVILIIITNATVGIVTSFFLKNLNSILKNYASAMELVLTAIVCYIIFGIPIKVGTLVSILLITIAVVFYFQNPVSNVSKPVEKEKQPFLPEEEAV